MKQWIDRHKRILQKAASALLAFMVGVCLVFMIHPVKTLPKDRLLSLSRMQEDSQQFVASSSKEPALEDLLSLELAKGEGKTQKNWVTLSAFVKKIGKAASFTISNLEPICKVILNRKIFPKLIKFKFDKLEFFPFLRVSRFDLFIIRVIIPK
jgi:hypothetical protein